MIFLTSVFLLFCIPLSYELNNGLGRTPQMGKIEKKNSFKERIYAKILPLWKYWIFDDVVDYYGFVHFDYILKDGIVGIISAVVSMIQ
jgi:hypothetical protein